MWPLQTRASPRRSKQPKQNNLGAWRCRVARRKSKLSVGPPKSPLHIKSDQCHQWWTRALWDIHTSFLYLWTHTFRQKPRDFIHNWSRAIFGASSSLMATWMPHHRLRTTFFALPTNRIDNTVVFPALCKPRLPVRSKNSSKFPLIFAACYTKVYL